MGSWIKDCLTFNITSKGQAAGELKELLLRIEKVAMGPKNLWTRLSFVLLFSIVLLVVQTSARPNPWFGEIYDKEFDKPQDRKNGETDIETRRPNSRMIDDESEVSSSSRFWDDLAPVFPRHLLQAFSGVLRLCDILRFAEETFASLLFPFSPAASRVDQPQESIDPGDLVMEHRAIRNKIENPISE